MQDVISKGKGVEKGDRLRTFGAEKQWTLFAEIRAAHVVTIFRLIPYFKNNTPCHRHGVFASYRFL